MPLDLPPAIETLVQRIARNPRVTRVILFGSRARGDNAPRADVDLAVDAPEGDSQDWADAMAAVEDAPTLLAIDLVWLPDAPQELRNEVELEGIVLYERQAR